MTMTEYQAAARGFATGGGLTLEYALAGLTEEAGEAMGKAAKFLRRTGQRINDLPRYQDEVQKIAAELGDCLWMIANAAACLDIPLCELAAGNIAKLRGRVARGTIIGEGDDR